MKERRRDWEYEELVTKNKEGSIYIHRERRFGFEHKSFLFKIDDGGMTVTIVEEIQGHKYSGLYNKNIILKPFQPDKAIFYCRDREEANFFAKKNLLLINGPFTIRLQGWNQEDTSLNKKLTFTRGWLEIEDLPLKWWMRDIFKVIRS
ncbi:hypothetical protein LguiB_027036 [Lonicera macranthoides]